LIVEKGGVTKSDDKQQAREGRFEKCVAVFLIMLGKTWLSGRDV
jgi:hypothetical protein